MEDIKISGMGALPGGEFHTVSVNGMGKCSGALSAEKITVNGTFKCEGSIDSRSLGVNGTLKCMGPLRAETASCNGAVDVIGDMTANELTVGGALHVTGGRLEGESITSTGTIHTEGQICADRLKASGIIKAREIVGDSISIHSGRFAIGFLKMFLSPAGSSADLIEATTVELSGVTAKAVNGRDVTIGPGCSIESLDCTGTLSIDPSSNVAHVSGEYTMRG